MYLPVSTHIHPYQAESTLRINLYQPKSTRINQNQPESTEINLYQPISIRLNPNQPVLTRINPYQPISTHINPNQPGSTRINPNQPKSTRINPYQLCIVHRFLLIFAKIGLYRLEVRGALSLFLVPKFSFLGLVGMTPKRI